MTDEHDLREILDRRASTITPDPAGSKKAVRRGRRRQLLNGSLSVLVVLGLGIGVFAGVRSLRSSQPITPVMPSPSPVTPSPDRETRTFTHSRYEVVIHFYSNGGHPPKDPSALPPPADDLLRGADVVTRSVSCKVVTGAEARRIYARLTAAFGRSDFIPYGFLGTPVKINAIPPHQRGCQEWASV